MRSIVSGTVKVDNSAFVEKYLANARRAKQKEDWEETEKYYNMVEQNDPTNIEAIFYSAYAKAKHSLIDRDIYKRADAFKVLTNCISIIDDNFNMDKEEENKATVKQISDDIIEMAQSSFVYNTDAIFIGDIPLPTNDKEKTLHLFNQLNAAFIESVQNIVDKYTNENDRIDYYKLMLTHANYVLKYGQLSNKKPLLELQEQLRAKLALIDPDYKDPYYIPPAADEDVRKRAVAGFVFGLICLIYSAFCNFCIMLAFLADGVNISPLAIVPLGFGIASLAIEIPLLKNSKKYTNTPTVALSKRGTILASIGTAPSLVMFLLVFNYL